MAKYDFLTEDNKITAVSSYAGRPVKASAKCDPKDKFNEAYGKELAQARCDVKVAYKRRQRAIRKMKKAREDLLKAQYQYNKMVAYFDDASEAYEEACDILLFTESKSYPQED